MHIGPGKLGLGLVVDSCLSAEINTHVVGRPHSKAAVGKFSLQLTEREPVPLEISSYSSATHFEQLDPDAKEAVGASSSLLVTTAVGDGLGDCAELIRSIAVQRSRNGEHCTVFIACENDTGEHYGEIEARLCQLGVECRRTMVNRICSDCVPSEDGTKLIVSADSYAEWLIEGVADREVLRDLERAAAVRFVEDVEPFAVRKRWLVNGGHLALAIFALMDSETSIAVVVNEPERQEQLSEIHGCMVQALPEKWVDILADSIEYAREQIGPMGRTEDETPRILRRLKRVDTVPFFEDADKKLGDPARRYVKRHGQLAYPLQDLFEVLDYALLDLESYVDAIKVRTRLIELDPATDERSVRAYGKLLDGVVNEATMAARMARFRRQLVRHRIAYA